MAKKEMQPYSALILLLSTELGICKLIHCVAKLLVSTRLTSLMICWKDTPQGYIAPAFVLKAWLWLESLQKFSSYLNVWG